MQSSAFTRLISASYMVGEPTVALYARNLKEAGLMTTGARGVNAPHMVPLDFARMTIALLATDAPARAVERIVEFGGLPFLPDGTGREKDVRVLSGVRPTLETVVERMFASDPEDDIWFRNVALEIHEQGREASLTVALVGEPFRADFLHHVGMPLPPVDPWSLKSRDRETYGILRVRGLGYLALLKVWLALWDDRQSRIVAGQAALMPVLTEDRQGRLNYFREYIGTVDPEWTGGA